MAVSIGLGELASGMMLTGATANGVLLEPAEPIRTRVERLGQVAKAIVEKKAPDAPEPVQNEAVVKLATYWFTQDGAVRFSGVANALVNSGAGHVLSRWVVRRAARAL